MINLVKSSVLSLGLLAGVGFAAHAQSDSVASLPPAAPAAASPAATAAVAPSAKLPGPNPGSGWYAQEQQTRAADAPSAKYVGPAPGGGWYPAEQHTQPVTPSTGYPGPRPN